MGTSKIKKEKIFISHATKDKETVDYLIHEILSPVLEKNSADFFYTSNVITGVKGSDDWKKTILDELENCSIFIALVTKNYRVSEFCITELGIAIGTKKKIFPIIKKLKKNNFSTVINHLQAIDIENQGEMIEFLKNLCSLYFLEKSFDKKEMAVKLKRLAKLSVPKILY